MSNDDENFTINQLVKQIKIEAEMKPFMSRKRRKFQLEFKYQNFSAYPSQDIDPHLPLSYHESIPLQIAMNFAKKYFFFIIILIHFFNVPCDVSEVKFFEIFLFVFL